MKKLALVLLIILTGSQFVKADNTPAITIEYKYKNVSDTAYFTNLKSNMKLIKILFLSLFLLSCNGSSFKYKIEGNIMAVSHEHYSFVPNYDTVETMRPAIAYTDTIYGQNKDSIWYYNTNGSKVTLLAPYKIYKIK